jgi:hypothetical protein
MKECMPTVCTYNLADFGDVLSIVEVAYLVGPYLPSLPLPLHFSSAALRFLFFFVFLIFSHRLIITYFIYFYYFLLLFSCLSSSSPPSISSSAISS